MRSLFTAKSLISICALFLFASHGNAIAGTLHYKNIIPGERASGMGGAFSAIADDPSGILFNPAGLVFSQSDYLSLSVNAYQFGSQQYQDVFSNKDYSLDNESLVPVFFGFTQQAGPGRFGFGVFVTDMQIIDQNDRIDGISSETDQLYAINRQLSNEVIQYLAGPAYSLQVHPSLTIGVTAFFGYGKEKFLDMQTAEFAPSDTGKYLIQNLYFKRQNYTFNPRFGMIFSPFSELSFSAVISKGFYIDGSGEYRLLSTRGEEGSTLPPSPTGELSNDYRIASSSNLYNRPILPTEITFGMAYFANEVLTVAVDGNYYSSDAGYQGGGTIKPTWNLSIGTELYIDPRVPLRAGVFTNRSNQPALTEGLTDQALSVNSIGLSFGGSLKSEGSSLSFTFIRTQGTGLGQILGGQTAIQTVKQVQTSIFFAGTYEL